MFPLRSHPFNLEWPEPKCLFFGAAIACAVSEANKVHRQGSKTSLLARSVLDGGSWLFQAHSSDAVIRVLGTIRLFFGELEAFFHGKADL